MRLPLPPPPNPLLQTPTRTCRLWFAPSSCVSPLCGSSSPPSTRPAAPCSTPDGSQSSQPWSSAGVCLVFKGAATQKKTTKKKTTEKKKTASVRLRLQLSGFAWWLIPLNKLQHQDSSTLWSPWAKQASAECNTSLRDWFSSLFFCHPPPYHLGCSSLSSLVVALCR